MLFPLKTTLAASAVAFAALSLTMSDARADAAADFYKDKRIDLIISSTVGGGNDLSARLIARHFSKNMPGNPGIVPRNMPGAGGVTAANHLYNIAPRDGLAIGMVQNSALFEPLFGNDKAIFDVAKFNWLGSPSKDVGVLILWHTVPVNTIEDARKRGLMLGVSGGLNATPAFYARVLAYVFDINIKMIAGYPGQSEAFLAMERGENEGYPSVFWSSLKVVKPDWIREKKIKMIMHFGSKPHPELANVPFAVNLLKDKPEKRQLMEVASAPLAVGRPMLAPPGVPADRVRALQDALAATLKDPAYLAECEKQNLECGDPTTGAELAKIIADTYNAPKATVNKLRELNNPAR
jgi:tripartite-type tricarboxylate transporter receptor subunit TctC